MKKYLAFGAVAAMGVMAVTVLGLANKEEAKNQMVFAELPPAISEGAQLEGNALYLCVESTLGWWISADAETRFLFENSSGEQAWSDPVVVGTSSTSLFDKGDEWGKPVYQAVVPNQIGGKEWVSFEAYRGRKNGTPSTVEVSGDDGYWWNKGGVQSISDGKNLYGLYSNEAVSYVEKVTASERLRIFAWSKDIFKPAAHGSSCGDAVTLPESAFQSGGDWYDAGVAFSSFGADVKNLFIRTAASPDAADASQPSVAGTAARYDWIYNKYHSARYYGNTVTNWAGRLY